ncbi:MAG: hypothetical protein ACRCU9_11915 [Iodobacter sp.]
MFMEMSSKENAVEFIVADSVLKSDQIEVEINETSFPDAGKKILNKHSTAIKASVEWVAKGKGQRVVLQSELSDYSHERYFEVLVRKKNDTKKDAVNNKIEMASFLIIRPDLPEMLYRINGNQLKNTGNAAFLFMEDTQCGQQQGKTILLAPGRVVDLPVLQSDSVLSIGQQEKIVVLEDQCKPPDH